MVVTKRDRRSNITLTVIDTEKVMADLYEQAKKAGKIPEDVVKIQPLGMNWAYIETPKGIFLLDNEACGPGGDEGGITEGSNVTWPIYHHKEKSLPMYPTAEIRLTPKDIKELPTKGEVNFGKWVRHFGHRLESNFHNWNSFLEDLMDPSRKLA
jgi:hypothetical protein